MVRKCSLCDAVIARRARRSAGQRRLTWRARRRFSTARAGRRAPERFPLMAKHASPQLLSNLGRTIEDAMALQRQGRLAEAAKIYTRTLQSLPRRVAHLP